MDSIELEKWIFSQNRIKSFLPKWKRDQLAQDEYIFYLLYDIDNDEESFFLVTDKALYKNNKDECTEVPLKKLISCSTIIGHVNVDYSFYVTSLSGTINFKIFRKSILIPFRNGVLGALKYHKNPNNYGVTLYVKKALKNPENNYYVCRNCGKKVTHNGIERIGGCESCKKYDRNELKAGVKIIEKEKGTIDYSDLSEYAELNNLKIEQMWEKRDPILMKWLGSKQIDTFAELLEYIEEIKLQNRLDQYKQDWDKKIPGTERFDLFYEYQNHMEKVRKNSISRHLDMTNSYDEITDILLFFIPTLGLLLLIVAILLV